MLTDEEVISNAKNKKIGEISKICRNARMESGYKQWEIARYIGCQDSTLGCFETAKSFSGKIFLWYFCNLLNEEERKKVCDIGFDEKYANRYEEECAIWRKKA